MAGEISQVAGVAVDALPPPVAASSNYSGPQRPKAEGSAEKPLPAEEKDVEGVQEAIPEDQAFLASLLARAPDAGVSPNTTFYFARAAADGRIYLHVKDKRTGEELYRIPRNYLADINGLLQKLHQIDFRV